MRSSLRRQNNIYGIDLLCVNTRFVHPGMGNKFRSTAASTKVVRDIHVVS